MMTDSGSTIDNSGRAGADYWGDPPPPYPGDIQPPTAAPGNPAQDDGKSCGTQATNGAPGVQGKTGITGKAGGEGGKGQQIKLVVKEMTGHYTCLSSGGDGGGGQTGGPGGTGQNGGPGGVKSDHCDAAGQGPAGPGGPGGLGGDAGPGGDAGDIYITYTAGNPPPTFDIQARPGAAGKANNGGSGGNPGSGNPAAGKGDGGKGGKSASGGKAGNVYVNGQPVKSS